MKQVYQCQENTGVVGDILEEMVREGASEADAGGDARRGGQRLSGQGAV